MPLLPDKTPDFRETALAGNILNDYAYGAKDTLTAITKLDNAGSAGTLAIGEICLQEAVRRPKQAAEWLPGATEKIHEAANAPLEDPSRLDHRTIVRARAQLRLAELPILAPLITARQLPTLETAQTCYQTQLAIAAELVAICKQTQPDDSQARVFKESIAHVIEAIPHLLDNRVTIAAKNTQQHYAIAGLVKATRGTRPPRCRVKNDWNVGIWSATDAGLAVLTSKIRITGRLGSDNLLYEPDISLVHVNPTLRISTGERIWPLKIIGELLAEQGSTPEVGAILDQRAVRLRQVLKSKK